MGTLRELFDTHGCDKGYKHAYERVYEPALKEVKEDQLNFLEIGTYRGESTEAFVEYLPNSTIYTIDTFQRIAPEDVQALTYERVKWIKGDSQSFGITKQIREEWGDIKFDFIIDDAQHDPRANMDTFKVFKQFLKSDGVYFIEDVWLLHKSGPEKNPWTAARQERYNMLAHNNFLSELEKGGQLRTHDLRVGGKPDSAILEWRW